MLRAIRGAITVERDEKGEIHRQVGHLLQTMLEKNQLDPSDLVLAFFTATPDLTSAFPASAARQVGLTQVPLMGAQELAVEGAPPRCVRVMLLAEGKAREAELPARHIYLGEAKNLRPDLVSGASTPESRNEDSESGSFFDLSPAENSYAQLPFSYLYFPQH